MRPTSTPNGDAMHRATSIPQKRRSIQRKCVKVTLISFCIYVKLWAGQHHPTPISSGLQHNQKDTSVVPEFKVVLSKIPPIDHKKKLMKSIYDIPAGSRLLRAEAKTGGGGRSNSFLCVFGMYRYMMEVCNIAMSVQHPFDDFMHIRDMLIECVCDILRMGPIAISKMRLRTITEHKALRVELDRDEALLHRDLPDHLVTLLADKHLLMSEKLAKNIEWPDAHLHDEIRCGFRLVGAGTKSNIFKPDFKPATITECELMKKSKFLRPALIGKLKSQTEVEHLDELHAITRAETTDKQWLTGPITADALHEEFGDGWIPVTRFAVKQKNKIRPIDNFAENFVSEAWSSPPEKLDLHSVDHVAWLLGIFGRLVFDKQCIDVTPKSDIWATSHGLVFQRCQMFADDIRS